MDANEKFDYENFDYDKCYKEMTGEIKKPNILICGQTGVGKSSLINDIFDINEAVVGTAGRPETKKIRPYFGASINLYDSPGYEIGDFDSNSYYNEVISFIDDKKKQDDMAEHIHEVWYCVSAGNKRFLPIDKKIINEVKMKDVPVMLLLTKVDLVDENELETFIKEVNRQVPSVNIYTCSTLLKDENESSKDESKYSYLPSDLLKKYVQRDEIISWALENLEDSLKISFIPSLKSSLKEKRNSILKTYVTFYSGSAAAVVLAASWIPVPFSDSVPLMAIQLKLAMAIINAYGIKTDAVKVVGGVAQTSFISYVGKTLASQLTSMIPIIGGGVKSVVNVTVAATLTAVWGSAVALLCEQYLQACIDCGGADNLAFKDYMTKEKIEEAINYVNEHKSDFNINDIVNIIVGNITKKNADNKTNAGKVSIKTILKLFSKNKK